LRQFKGIMRILLTRPIDDSARTVAALKALGHEALVAPLFEIRSLPHQLPQKPDMLLATSANALRTCEPGEFVAWLDLPFFAVGDATANAAKAFGFSKVISAGANSIALAALIRSQARRGSHLLQLAGKPRRDVAIQALEGDYKLSTVETYETVACSHLPDTIAVALRRKNINAVMHFSPRAATTFMDLVEVAGLVEIATDLRHICISSTARDSRFGNAIIATHPTLGAMLEALSRA
jgi:uroporphyrinogen-III synthase